MGRTIIRLEDAGVSYYLEWSSVVDAPVTGAGTLEEFREYYRQEYGESGMRDLDQRMKRVEAKGTSSHMDDSVDDQIAFNRAGERETCLTKEQIIAHYVRGEPRATGRNVYEIDE